MSTAVAIVVRSEVNDDVTLASKALLEAERRRVEAERVADELQSQMQLISAELDEVRASRDELSDELNEAVRANEAGVIAALRMQSDAADQMNGRARPHTTAGISGQMTSGILDRRRQRRDDGRTFERFVDLTRQLNDERELNEKLRDELKRMSSARGRQRRTMVVKVTRADGRIQQTIARLLDDTDDVTSGRCSLLQTATERPQCKSVTSALGRRNAKY